MAHSYWPKPGLDLDYGRRWVLTSNPSHSGAGSCTSPNLPRSVLMSHYGLFTLFPETWPGQRQGPSWYYTETNHTGYVCGQDWTPESHWNIIKSTLPETVSGPEKWVHNSFFPVSVLVQVQCEKFFLKPYNPFFLVQGPIPVPVPETASVNTPL